MASTVKPIITPSVLSIASSTTTITISGSNFGSSAAVARVYLEDASNSLHPVAIVQSFSSTRIIASVTQMMDRQAGTLYAVVAVNGVESVRQAVATIVSVAPLVSQGRQRIAKSSAGKWHIDHSLKSVFSVPNRTCYVPNDTTLKLDCSTSLKLSNTNVKKSHCNLRNKIRFKWRAAVALIFTGIPGFNSAYSADTPRAACGHQ